MSRRGPTNRLSGLTGKAGWRWFKRAATVIFFMLMAWLLVTQARAIEWGEVFASLAHYPLSSLAGVVVLALLSLLLYSAFDLLGRHYTGHTLRTMTVMRVTFICYVFNLNLGSLVGSVALRYRLYSRLGLSMGTITRIMTLSLLTNWMGYLLLAGVLFGFYTPVLPAGWEIDSRALQIFGFVLLVISFIYLLLCALSRQRSFSLRGHELSLPSLHLAALQLLLGAANWLLMGGMIFMALQQKIGLFTVVGVLLVAAVASFIAHVPAGLGVLEAIFVIMLSPQLPRSELLAALLIYRMIYYLIPLALAVVMYLVAEKGAKKIGSARVRQNTGSPTSNP